jgi:hypothetical protein
VRPVTQSILHDDPDGRPGNCLQAAVASLLELPLQSVPHFVSQASDWLERMAAFCNAHGYQLQTQPVDEHCAYGMAWGPSERGVRHAVCWADGRMVHDPHPSRVGLLHVTDLIAFTRAPAADGCTPAGDPPMSPSPKNTTDSAPEQAHEAWPFPWPPPVPQLGARVHYRLDHANVRAIHRQRLAAHVRGAAVRAGDVCPAVIVRVSGDVHDAPCNLQVALDGPDRFWVQQVTSGTNDGTWAWPTLPAGV